MTKTQSITTGGFAFLGVLAAWQFLQIQELREANSLLTQNIKPVQAERSPAARAPERTAGDAVSQGAETNTPGGASASAPAPEDAERAAREARFREMRVMDRAQRHDARVLNLTTKLNLSADQQTRLREILQSASAERDALREAGDGRRRSGAQETDEERRADRIRIANVDLQQEERIAGLLSDEQSGEYANYKAEQKAQSDENWANQRLRELQDRFSLTEDQKEAAFQYFAKQEREEGFDLSQVMATGEDPMDRVRKMEQDRLEALKGILTPEQFELHSAQQAQREEMFRSMQPGGPGAAPALAPRRNP